MLREANTQGLGAPSPRAAPYSVGSLAEHFLSKAATLPVQSKSGYNWGKKTLLS